MACVRNWSSKLPVIERRLNQINLHGMKLTAIFSFAAQCIILNMACTFKVILLSSSEVPDLSEHRDAEPDPERFARNRDRGASSEPEPNWSRPKLSLLRSTAYYITMEKARRYFLDVL